MTVILPTQPVEVALFWAAQGWPVFPCRPNDKAPYTANGFKNGMTDEAAIRAAWTQHPHAMVGGATGPGRSAVDLDTKLVDGIGVWSQLGFLDDLPLWTSRTPSGGVHRVYSHIGGHPSIGQYPWFGIDIRNDGGYVILPGSVTSTGTRYELLTWNGSDTKAEIDWTEIDRFFKEENQPTMALWLAHLTKEKERRERAREANRLKREALAAGPQTTPTPRSSRLVSPLQPAGGGGVKAADPEAWLRIEQLVSELSGTPDGLGHQEIVRICFEAGSRIVRHGQADENSVIRAFQDGLRWTFRDPNDEYRVHRDIEVSVRDGVARGTGEPWRSGIRRATRPPVQHATLVVAPRPSVPQAPPSPTETPSGGDLVPVSEAGIPEPVRNFWNRRPELREVWFRSAIEDVSPWAVLGHVLANVAGRVGPHVRLPPKGGYGSPTSLNVLVAVSGNSGEGKGLSSQVARGLMGAPRPPQRKPGTGQGIAAMFTEQTKEGPVQSNDTVVLNVAEITQLGAHMGQQGATITSTLLEVYMAEELGEHYANKELRRPVKEGTYRLALVAGVQPDNAGIIFDHAASGLPQRFLWFPAHWDDAVLPESGLVPPAPGTPPPVFRGWHRILPGTLDDSLQAGTDWSPSDAAAGMQTPHGGKKAKEPEALPAPVKDEILVEYGPQMWNDVRTDSRRRRNLIKAANTAGEEGSGDPDSHLLLNRIKAATHLSIWLDHSITVSDEMWELSYWLMWVCNWTRQKTHGRIRTKAAEKNQARAVSQVAVRDAVGRADSEKASALVTKVADRIRAVVGKANGEWISHRDVTLGLASRDKKAMRELAVELDDVLGDLIQVGVLEGREPEGTERGMRYRVRK